MAIISDQSVQPERSGEMPGRGAFVVASTSMSEEIARGKIAYGRLLFYQPRPDADRRRACITWFVEVGTIPCGPCPAVRPRTAGTEDGVRRVRELVLDDLGRHFYAWVAAAWDLRDRRLDWDSGLLFARTLFGCDGWAVDEHGAVLRDRVPRPEFKAYRALYRAEGGETLWDAYFAYCRWLAEKRGNALTRTREALVGSARALRARAWDGLRAR